MAFDLEQSRFLTELRQKSIRRGSTPATPDEIAELRRGIEMLRQDREGASVGATKSRSAKAAAKAPIDTKSLLEGLKKQGDLLKGQTFGG